MNYTKLKKQWEEEQDKIDDEIANKRYYDVMEEMSIEVLHE